MRTVWKYRPDPLTGEFMARVSGGERVVLVAAQAPGDTLPTLWIEHDPGAPRYPHYYQCIGTGNLMKDYTGEVPSTAGEHVGSAVCANGGLIWHVYRIPG